MARTPSASSAVFEARYAEDSSGGTYTKPAMIRGRMSWSSIQPAKNVSAGLEASGFGGSDASRRESSPDHSRWINACDVWQ